jgi:uncharacterized protein
MALLPSYCRHTLKCLGTAIGSAGRLLVVVAFCAPAVRGQDADSARAAAVATSYAQRDVMIPMRDGVRLHTAIYTPPRGAAGALPILFSRTPYGVTEARMLLRYPYRELAAAGYVFAFQDIRGRYQSEGQFVMQRPARAKRDARSVDEGTDAYDTIDWLVKHVPNANGRVGMLGVSYDGWTTAMALLEPHPALRAASPQASPADMFLGDDFHHNGAFRLSYGFEYAAMMETSKENERFAFDRYDTYDWYLALGPLATVNAKYLRGRIPTWNDFVAHPNYDAFWQRQTLVPALTRLNRVTVPTLNVAGWWDQEDFYGPQVIYQALERRDTERRNFFVAGPWQHGGWTWGPGRTLGNIDFGSATARYFRERIQAPFFAFYLKDEGTLRQPEATVFEGGSNRWRTFDRWPPTEGVARRALYFQPNGGLAFTPPAAGMRDTVDEYVSDPAHPVPYRSRPIQPTYDPRGSGWYTWLTEDQRFVDDRPDVRTWATPPLVEDVTIAGDVSATLFASTTGTDADWVVKLIDVFPEDVAATDTTQGGKPLDVKMNGYEFMIANEVFRARFRESFERPRAVVANVPAEYTFSLHGQSFQFRRGHRIMVQVQSTWFPLIDRNPQTFVSNIFEARAEDFRAQTHRILRSAALASHVTLPVVLSPVP